MADEPASFDPLRGTDRARLAASSADAAPGPVFVSRGASPRKRALDPLRGADGNALPSLRDARVRWMIALVLVLQTYAWWRVSGYQLADSVEFMERAQIFERGERMIDAGVIRPFGFSFVLVPFFALADWFGLHDQRAVVWCVVLFQMLLGCVLTWRCMRIGARVAGNSGAMAAGLFVACNPVFLQYSTQPVSDIAAGVCVAFAVEGVLERGSFRRSLYAGLWLSLAFVVAYKSLLISLAVFVMLFVRDRWKHSATWRGLVVGVTIGLLIQSTLDWLMYGQFGASLITYLVQNGGSVIASFVAVLYKITHSQRVYDIGKRIYEVRGQLGTSEDLSASANMPAKGDMLIHGLQSPWFYIVQMPTMIVWPALVVLCAGLLRAVLRPSWKAWLCIGAMSVCLFVMSNKGSKDFRLWLPLLPLLVPITAFGWDWIASGITSLARGARPVLATLGVGALIAFGLRQLSMLNVRHFGGYWTAIDWIDARAHDTLAQRRERSGVTGELGEPAPLRVGSAYNWAVFLRGSPLVEVVKLPWQLNMWKQYEKNPDHGAPQKSDDMATIADLDVLIVHLPILSQNHDLMRWVNAHFELAAAFYDQRTYDDIGPIFVLERRTGSANARTFFDFASPTSDAIDPARLAGTNARTMDFVGADGDRIELVDVAFETLPPQGFGWVTYRWRALTPLHHDYWGIDRITSPDESNVWQNNHPLAYGSEPSSQWTPGVVLSESFLVVAGQDAFLPQGRVRPIGGAYRRGDLIPTRTWMKVQAFDPASLDVGQVPVVVAELTPARPSEPRPIRSDDEQNLFETPDGIQFSGDGFVRVASFFVPVLAPWKLPDDGKPVPP